MADLQEHETSPGAFVGILGGMGPLATVDLMHKIILACPSVNDQGHVPVIAHNVPQIPDRQKFLAGVGPSPLPAMVEGLRRLEAAGAGVVAIPCNTAHIWYDNLVAASHVPIIHIAQCAVDELVMAPQRPVRVGLLATEGTSAAGFYQRRLAAAGFTTILLDASHYANEFTPGCYAIKANDLILGATLMKRCSEHLIECGAEAILMACTEVPIALASLDSPLSVPLVDATDALARACIRWWQRRRP